MDNFYIVDAIYLLVSIFCSTFTTTTRRSASPAKSDSSILKLFSGLFNIILCFKIEHFELFWCNEINTQNRTMYFKIEQFELFWCNEMDTRNCSILKHIVRFWVSISLQQNNSSCCSFRLFTIFFERKTLCFGDV